MPSEDLAYEKRLFSRIADGDERAFREVFDRYKKPFYAAAIKMTRSGTEAEEIVQDVFVELWQRRDSLRGAERPASYLFAMVYHEIARHFRRQALERRIKQHVLEKAQPADESTEQLLELKDCESSLNEAIEALPPQQQLVYRLSRQEGFSREEIARQLHISPNTVKNHLLRALREIRTRLHYPLMLLVLMIW